MKTDSKPAKCFPLRLPTSLRHQAVDSSQSEGVPLNHFITLAVAEKLARMERTAAPKEGHRDLMIPGRTDAPRHLYS
jgi:hypothetical protein